MKTKVMLYAVVTLALFLASGSSRADESGSRPPGMTGLQPYPRLQPLIQEEGYQPLQPIKRPEPPIQEEGYQPLQPLPRPEPRVDEPFVPPEDEPVARVHSRVYFQSSFLTGREIGHDEGAFQDAPSFNQAFSPGLGLGVDFVYSVTPLFAFQYNLSFQHYGGRNVDSGIDPQSGGKSVDYDAMWVFKTSVGPRLSFPIELPSKYWDEREAIPYVQGLVPYVRTGIGYALSGEVEATFGGEDSKYYNMTGSLHLTFGIGTEVHGKKWGGFVEMFAIERWGPLDAAREPEAKGVTVIAFPFSFGVTYRY